MFPANLSSAVFAGATSLQLHRVITANRMPIPHDTTATPRPSPRSHARPGNPRRRQIIKILPATAAANVPAAHSHAQRQGHGTVSDQPPCVRGALTTARCADQHNRIVRMCHRSSLVVAALVRMADQRRRNPGRREAVRQLPQRLAHLLLCEWASHFRACGHQASPHHAGKRLTHVGLPLVCQVPVPFLMASVRPVDDGCCVLPAGRLWRTRQ